MTQHIAWHHVACEVPAAWEVTRYSVESRAGRLEFATRRGIEALMSWEPCRREPDRRGTMAGFLGELGRGRAGEAPPAAGAFRTSEAGVFLAGWDPSRPQVQALAWLAKSRTLVRWIFEQAVEDGRPAAWVRPLLESCRPNEGPQRDYALFGIRCRLPAEFEIERMAAYPANVMIRFESPRRQSVVLRRWGIPGHIMGGDSLDVFYRRILAVEDAAIAACRPARVSGCEGYALEYSQRPEHRMERFFGRSWAGGRALVWHDRDEERLYACEQIGPPGVEPLAWPELLPGRTVIGQR